MLSIPMIEARAVHARSLAGDEAAKEFFDGLFSPGQPCWLCDEPVGTSGTAIIFPDAKLAGFALVAPECRSCVANPQRLQRQVAMLRAMWPQVKWRAERDRTPGYMRGRRVKERHRSLTCR